MRNTYLAIQYRKLVNLIRTLDIQITELSNLRQRILVLEQQVRDLPSNEDTRILLIDLNNIHNRICLDLLNFRYDKDFIEGKLRRLPLG